jgi:hypothetical protein
LSLSAAGQLEKSKNGRCTLKVQKHLARSQVGFSRLLQQTLRKRAKSVYSLATGHTNAKTLEFMLPERQKLLR